MRRVTRSIAGAPRTAVGSAGSARSVDAEPTTLPWWPGCDRCGLTPGGAELLERAAASSEPRDLVVVVRCEACGLVTAIVAADGSSFGADVGTPPPPRNGHPIASTPAVQRRPHRRRRWIPVAFGGALSALVAVTTLASMLAIASAHVGRRGSDRTLEPPSGSVVANVGADVGADGGTADREALVLPFARPLDALVDRSPPSVALADVDAIGHATWVAAATTISNTGERPVAPSEVMFEVVDGTGEVVAEYSTYVALEGRETKTVGAARIELPRTLPTDASVRVSVAPATRIVASDDTAPVAVTEVRLERSGRIAVVTGRVDDRAGDAHHVTLTCAVRTHDGELAGVGVTTLQIPTRASATFRLVVRGATASDLATCDAS